MTSADCFLPDWVSPGSVRALSTTRSGGVSLGSYESLNLGSHVGDHLGHVLENRGRLRRLLPSEPLWLNQVHGTRVVHADAIVPNLDADAAVTSSPGQVLAIQTADCLPILLCDRMGSIVGAAHAGWRGLAAGVLENAVQAMDRSPGELMAWLGPAIGPLAYEVGQDVVDVFMSGDAGAAVAFAPKGSGKYLADLYALARRRLSSCGVFSVSGGYACTYSEPERFFSHRRTGVTGRMATLIWIEP